MSHYDTCRPENCPTCGQARGYCEHATKEERRQAQMECGECSGRGWVVATRDEPNSDGNLQEIERCDACQSGEHGDHMYEAVVLRQLCKFLSGRSNAAKALNYYLKVDPDEDFPS